MRNFDLVVAETRRWRNERPLEYNSAVYVMTVLESHEETDSLLFPDFNSL
jgi:hypothetical protein